MVRRAERVWAVSDENRERFAALYDRPASSIELAVNGTHVPGDAWLDTTRRAALKERLGLGGRPLAIFVASYHGPNLPAADDILAMAHACPEWAFALVGSVCHHLKDRALPSNLMMLGTVEEKALRVLLRAADVGLNPMRSGSGTNLKMLDYAGHGLLILSTPTGARGLAFTPQIHYLEREIEDFPATLSSLVPQCPAPHPDARAAARQLVEQVYEWNTIAAALKPSSTPAVQ